jgi:hypothetical protein
MNQRQRWFLPNFDGGFRDYGFNLVVGGVVKKRHKSQLVSSPLRSRGE